MIVTALIPRFPLRIALLEARMPWDTPIALGPEPGAPQVIGPCTPSAWSHGVRPGLRVGEALARCPGLDLVMPDPDAARSAAERVTLRLENRGAAVAPGDDGESWSFAATGLIRMHGGMAVLMRRARAALPVGADGRVGAAPTPFASREAARAGVVIHQDEVADFLAPLPAGRLPLPQKIRSALEALGIRSMGQVAHLPRASVLDRLGPTGVAAWEMTRGEDDPCISPRVPPQPVGEEVSFPESIGALPALEAALRILIARITEHARTQGGSVRSIIMRARLEDGGSWTHAVALREATCDPRRIGIAALPHLARITAPVTSLAIEADAGGPPDAGQLALVSTPDEERMRRAGAALAQVRAAGGAAPVLRLVEIEPWSRLPERTWALGPYEA